MENTTNNFMRVIETAGLTSLDSDKLSLDLQELSEISDSLPKDNVFSIENCLNLERSCIRGLNICDYWTPVIHIVLSEQESERDMQKNKIYINPKQTDQAKLTAEMRKAYSESDPDYNKIKVIVERVKGLKFFFEKKRETFKSAIFVFKDQLASYKLSDKGNSGESLSYENGQQQEKKFGKISW